MRFVNFLQVMFFRHLHQEHFYQFVKLDLLASMLGDGTGKIPRPTDLNVCPFKQGCVMRDKQRQCNGLGYVAEHVSVQVCFIIYQHKGYSGDLNTVTI